MTCCRSWCGRASFSPWIRIARPRRAARDRLAPLKIGKWGQFRNGRRISTRWSRAIATSRSFYALHPAAQITVHGTPDLAAAAKKTLERRLANGGGHTGWSRAWIINFWARLEEAELAHENVMALLRNSTLGNLFDTHPPSRSMATSAGPPHRRDAAGKATRARFCFCRRCPKPGRTGIQGVESSRGLNRRSGVARWKAVRGHALRRHRWRAQPARPTRARIANATSGGARVPLAHRRAASPRSMSAPGVATGWRSRSEMPLSH